MADPEGRAGGGEGGLGAVPQQGCREHSPPEAAVLMHSV